MFVKRPKLRDINSSDTIQIPIKNYDSKDTPIDNKFCH
jgi:hypothetical protein